MAIKKLVTDGNDRDVSKSATANSFLLGQITPEYKIYRYSKKSKRAIIFITLLVFALLLINAHTALAQPIIEQPVGWMYRGNMTVIGTADETGYGQPFAKYTVERKQTVLENWNSVPAPVWTTVKTSLVPVNSGTLAVFSGTGLNGQFDIRVTAYDKAGNVSSATTFVAMDNKIPVLRFTGPQGMIANTKAASLEVAGTDIFSGIDFWNSNLWINSTRIDSIDFTFVGDTISYTPGPASPFFDTIDTAGFSSGIYSYEWQVKDQAGNLAKKSGQMWVRDSMTMAADKVKPSIGSVLPIAGSVTKLTTPTVTVSGIADSSTGIDTSSLSLIINGTNIPTGSITFSAGKLTHVSSTMVWQEGENSIFVAVADNAGNMNSKQWNFFQDVSAPVPTINTPLQDDWLRGIVPVKGTVVDAYLKNFVLEHWNPSTGLWASGFSGTLPSPDAGTLGNWKSSSINGIRYLRLKATDKVGNMSYHPTAARDFPTQGIKVTLDNIAPKSIGIQPTNGFYIKSPYDSEITVTGVEDLNQFKTTASVSGFDITQSQLKLDGIPVTTDLNYDPVARTYTYDPVLGFPDGLHMVEMVLADEMGNSTKKGPSFFTVDNTIPSVELALPTSIFNKSSKVAVPGRVNDANLKNFSLRMRENPSSSWVNIATGITNTGNSDNFGTLGTWNVPGVIGNQYEIELRAEDKAGNIATDTAGPISVLTTGGYSVGDTLEISTPTPAKAVRKTVEVLGSASLSSSFAYYRLYRRTSPTGALSLIKQSSLPVEEGTLSSWSTPGSGVYDLVLQRYQNPGAPVYLDSTTMSAVMVDNTVPVIPSITSVLEQRGVVPNYVNSSNPTMQIKYLESHSGIDTGSLSVWLDGLPMEADFSAGGNAALNIPSQAIEVDLGLLLEGPHTLKAKVSDKAGNISTEKTYLFTVDSDAGSLPTPPMADIWQPWDGGYFKGIVSIMGSAYDPSLLDYQLSHRKSDTTAYTLIFKGLASVRDATLAKWSTAGSLKTLNGEFELLLKTKDKSGFIRTDAVEMVTDNTQPVASITHLNGITAAMITNVTAGVTVAVSGKAYDRGGKDDLLEPNDSFDSYFLEYGPGLAPLDWEWNWVPGGWGFSALGSETTNDLIAIWDTSLVLPGVYTLRLTVYERAIQPDGFQGSKTYKKVITVIP